MNEWYTLFGATASASATLTGLLFVGVSINLQKILALKGLAERALVSMILLLLILVVSIMMLIPKESFAIVGSRLLVFTIISWLIISLIDFRAIKQIKHEFKPHFILNIILDQVAMLIYIISAIMVLVSKETGLYWVASAFIFSFVKAVTDAWVLLVEINR
ncbi:MAG: hypothetical protein QM726_07320 [Chitinophagaceae bacterium]